MYMCIVSHLEYTIRKYQVEYMDGMTETLYGNIIAANILVKVYQEGKMQIILDEAIKYHVGPNTMTITNRYYQTKDI